MAARRLVVTLLTLCSLVIPLTLGSPTAFADASACTQAGPTVVEQYPGYSLPTINPAVWHTRYCDNYRGGSTVLGGRARGYLYAGHNWFACQYRFAKANPTVGSATNHYWLWTEGDVQVNGPGSAWGWFPATYVRQGENERPVPGIATCSPWPDFGP